MLLLRTRLAIGKVLYRVAPDRFGPLLVAGLVGRAWYSPVGPPRLQRRLDWAVQAVAESRRLVAVAPGRHERLLARALVLQARRLTSLDRHQEAVAVCDEAAEIDARFPAPAGDRLGPGGAALVRAGAMTALDRPADALAAAEAAAGFFRREIAGGNRRARPLLAAALASLGRVNTTLGRTDEAGAAFAAAIEEYERLPFRQRFLCTIDIALARALRADLLCRLRKYDEALRAADEALQWLDTLATLMPLHLPIRALTRVNLAIARGKVGKLDGARAAATRAVADYRRLATADPAEYADLLAWSLELLAERCAALGRHDEAAGTLHEAVAIRRSQAADPTASAESHAGLASALEDLSDALWELDQRVESTELSGEVAATYRTAAEQDSGYDSSLLRALRVLADRLAETGRDAEAALVGREAAAVSRRLSAREDPPDPR